MLSLSETKYDLVLIVRGDASAVHELVRVRGGQRRSRFCSFMISRFVVSNQALENDINRKLTNIAAHGLDYYARNPLQMKSVGGGVLELKLKTARVFLFERGFDVIVLDGYRKAKKKTQSAAIAIAQRDRRAFLDFVERSGK